MAEGTVPDGAGLFRPSRFRFPSFFPRPWFLFSGIANQVLWYWASEEKSKKIFKQY